MNTKITHIIKYQMPFQQYTNGNPCILSFGLSNQGAAMAILCINFLCKMKAALWSYYYDDAEPNVHTLIWKMTLKVQYKPPMRRGTPRQQMRFRGKTTLVDNIKYQ
jgi:hypothetical protein